MPSFVWKGKLRSGQLQQGTLLADSRSAAVATLRRQQITITTIRERGRRIPLIPKLPVRISSKRLAIFTRQFSVMLDAGLPLVQCIELLGVQEEHRPFREIITQVRLDVESGSSLADSMAKHPAAFDELYVNMIQAGETGGILDIILQRLSTYIEKNVKPEESGQIGSDLPRPQSSSIAIFVVCIILVESDPGVRPTVRRSGRRDAPALPRIVVVITASNFTRPLFAPFLIPVMIIGHLHRVLPARTSHAATKCDGLHRCRTLLQDTDSSACLLLERSPSHASAVRCRP